MSNTRLFAIGWMCSGLVRLVIDLAGWSGPSGLVAMIKGALLGISFGIGFVAVWGDRDRRTPATSA